MVDRISRGDIGEDEGREEGERDSDVLAAGGEGFVAALGGACPRAGQDDDGGNYQGNEVQMDSILVVVMSAITSRLVSVQASFSWGNTAQK